LKQALIVLVVFLSACTGYDVEALCEELDAECNQGVDFADCVEDGRKMEEQASDADCDEQLDEYLTCLEIGACRWETRCSGERDRLVLCAGEFPNL
jgi:hypothetical protein